MGQSSSSQVSQQLDITRMRTLGRTAEVDIEEDPVEVAQWMDKDAVKGVFLTYKGNDRYDKAAEVCDAVGDRYHASYYRVISSNYHARAYSHCVEVLNAHTNGRSSCLRRWAGAPASMTPRLYQAITTKLVQALPHSTEEKGEDILKWLTSPNDYGEEYPTCIAEPVTYSTSDGKSVDEITPYSLTAYWRKFNRPTIDELVTSVESYHRSRRFNYNAFLVCVALRTYKREKAEALLLWKLIALPVLSVAALVVLRYKLRLR